MKNPYLDAAKAEDLGDLLDHMGWREVLRPALLHEREMFTKLLVSATLGAPVEIGSKTGPVRITQEQLAGKIYGIDFILDKIESILTRGARAVTELRSQGVNLATPNYGSRSDTSST
jgi:hypothetical protein